MMSGWYEDPRNYYPEYMLGETTCETEEVVATDGITLDEALGLVEESLPVEVQ